MAKVKAKYKASESNPYARYGFEWKYRTTTLDMQLPVDRYGFILFDEICKIATQRLRAANAGNAINLLSVQVL
jgi:hypothetical protein